MVAIGANKNIAVVRRPIFKPNAHSLGAKIIHDLIPRKSFFIVQASRPVERFGQSVAKDNAVDGCRLSIRRKGPEVKDPLEVMVIDNRRVGHECGGAAKLAHDGYKAVLFEACAQAYQGVLAQANLVAFLFAAALISLVHRVLYNMTRKAVGKKASSEAGANDDDFEWAHLSDKQC